MLISVEELSKSMEAGGVDPECIEKIKAIAAAKQATHILADEEEIIALGAKVGSLKGKDQIKKEISDKCNTFTTNAENLLIIIVLTIFLMTALGLVFGFGTSLFEKKEEQEPASEQPIAQA